MSHALQFQSTGALTQHSQCIRTRDGPLRSTALHAPGHVALQRRPTAAFIRKGPCLTLTPHAAPPTDADINTITDTTNFQSEQQRQDSSSPCPFLASLPRPPSVSTVPWYKRLKELLDPREFQQLVVKGAGGSQVVQVPKQMAFDEAVIPLSADLVKEVMNGESNGTVKQTTIPSLLKMMGDKNLVLVQEPRHKYLRTLLQPAFSKEAVNSYLPDIQALVEGYIQEWAAAGDAGVKALDSFKLMTFDYIISLTLGYHLPKQELVELSATYRKYTSGFLAWPWKEFPFSPYSAALRAREVMMSRFWGAVTEARGKAAAGEDVPGILGRMIAAVDEDGNRLSDEEITDNILLLLLAGQDTSSTTLTRCMSNLQDNPAVVDKLRQEQELVVKKHGDVITADALKEMVYADAVIRETLRLDPVVAQLTREAATDFNLGGYKVPAGMSIMCPLGLAAMQDDRWSSEEGQLAPSVFNPERMLTGDGNKPGSQMPFGYGPRYCLGAALAMAEMKVFLALLLRSYDFTADNNTEWTINVGMVPKNGLPLVLKKRPQAA